MECYFCQLPPPGGHTLYRHRQLTKIAFHCLVSKLLSIDLKQDNGMLFLSTADDGRGYDHQAAAKGEGGIGLRNILNRTEIIGGQMFVESEINKGTKYSFEIPV